MIYKIWTTYQNHPLIVQKSISTISGRTYERRTDRGPPAVGKHGDALRRSYQCDLPPTTLDPPRPRGGRDQKSPPCWDKKRLRIQVPRHLADLADCCWVFPEAAT